MPTLAIAGGTSPSLGRAIISAMLLSQPTSSWNAVILSRNSKVPIWLRALDKDSLRTEIRIVDYLNTDSITAALDGVHTVVSITSAIDGTQPQIQVNLLDAAIKAGCKRFAPAQWGFGRKGWKNIAFMKEDGERVWAACEKNKDKIESGMFNIGSFMNYLGHGIYPEPASPLDDETTIRQLQEGEGYADGEDEAIEGLQRQGDLKDGSGGILIGMKNAIAQLPIKDNGQWPRVTFITMRDVGRFVVASLDLLKWEEDMTMVGDTLSLGELLAYAEEVSGKKFEVETISKADEEKRLGEIDKNDFMAMAWCEFRLAFIRDQEDEAIVRPIVNELCPSVKPTSVREYLEKHWTRA